MQTFLPYASFRDSAKVLDNKRLGKQRIEARMILEILNDGSASKSRWRNHPAVKLWQDHRNLLCLYGMEICLEWRYRGFKDKQLVTFANSYAQLSNSNSEDIYSMKYFSKALHASHRAALLAKNPEHYSQFQWDEKPEIKYVWR